MAGIQAVEVPLGDRGPRAYPIFRIDCLHQQAVLREDTISYYENNMAGTKASVHMQVTNCRLQTDLFCWPGEGNNPTKCRPIRSQQPGNQDMGLHCVRRP